MSKPTGTIERRGGKLFAKITMPGTGKRERFPLDPSLTDEQARAAAQEIDAGFRSGKLSLPAPKPARTSPDAEPLPGSLRAWSLRWLDARKAKGLASWKDDLSRLRTHVWPVLGDEPMATVGAAALEAFVAHLDTRVQAKAMSWKLARNIWGAVSKMFADASRSKLAALRVRSDNPARDVAPPDGGEARALVYLYPSEAEALLSCERVPMRWRRLIALASYLFVRAGELEALRCEDVDLEHGALHVHESIDRYRDVGKRKGTKGKRARRVAIDPAIVPLLRVMMCEAGGTGPLVKMPAAEDLPERLRKYLLWAGVTRTELQTTSATSRRLTWHDLRATGITWCAVRGDQPLAIQQRAGHADFATTQKYIREAQSMRAGFGVPFPPLPAALLGTVPVTVPNCPEEPKVNTKPASAERPQRDSNPERPHDSAGFSRPGTVTGSPGVTGRATDSVLSTRPERRSRVTLRALRGYVAAEAERFEELIRERGGEASGGAS